MQARKELLRLNKHMHNIEQGRMKIVNKKGIAESKLLRGYTVYGPIY